MNLYKIVYFLICIAMANSYIICMEDDTAINIKKFTNAKKAVEKAIKHSDLALFKSTLFDYCEEYRLNDQNCESMEILARTALVNRQQELKKQKKENERHYKKIFVGLKGVCGVGGVITNLVNLAYLPHENRGVTLFNSCINFVGFSWLTIDAAIKLFNAKNGYFFEKEHLAQSETRITNANSIIEQINQKRIEIRRPEQLIVPGPIVRLTEKDIKEKNNLVQSESE